FSFVYFSFCKGQTNIDASRQNNYIDSIQNAKEIESLIVKINPRFKEFEVNESMTFDDRYSGENYHQIADSLNIQPWTKADFDHNGLTDILVIGKFYGNYVICILDNGGKYEIYPITKGLFKANSFPIVEDNKIKYYCENESDRIYLDKPIKLEESTLIYQFGDFIEENTTPAKHKIEKIEYETTGCYGICPIFSLTINADQSAEWEAKRYNKIKNEEVEEKFHSNITEDNWNELIDLLNYIDFEKLNDNYSVKWTDNQSSTLKITYDNGKVKSIQEYGLVGTFGLSRVYEILFDLRENQKWE